MLYCPSRFTRIYYIFICHQHYTLDVKGHREKGREREKKKKRKRETQIRIQKSKKRERRRQRDRRKAMRKR